MKLNVLATSNPDGYNHSLHSSKRERKRLVRNLKLEDACEGKRGVLGVSRNIRGMITLLEEFSNATTEDERMRELPLLSIEAVEALDSLLCEIERVNANWEGDRIDEPEEDTP